MMRTVGLAGLLGVLLCCAGGARAQDAAATASDGAALPPAAEVAAPVSASPSDGATAAPPAAPVADAMASIRQNGCLLSPARASDAQISRFIEQPASLLSNYGITSLELSGLVRSLVGSDTRALEPAIATLAAASVDQRAAIGSGLGRAAFACQEVNPDYAALIQSKVSDLVFADVKTAFLAATNDIQVAAIAGAAGAAGGAGAPGLSGGGVAGPGTAGAGGDDTVPTTSVVYDVGNLGGVSYVEGNGGESSTALIAGSPASVD